MIKLKDLLKEGSGFSEVDPGPKRWFKPYGDKYTEYEKATNKDLKEGKKMTKVHVKQVQKLLKPNMFKSVENVIPHKDVLFVTYTNYRDRAKIIKQVEKLYKYDNDGRSTNAPRGIMGLGGTNWIAFTSRQNESVNEVLPKFKTPYEAYSWIMNKRGEAMDIETEMMETSKEIQMAYGEMEQDAEPGGGPIADRYGKEIEALENKHKDLRAEFDMVMAEIDEYDQNY